MYKQFETSNSPKLHKIMGVDFLQITDNIFTELAYNSFVNMRYFLPKSHIKNWQTIINSQNASLDEKQKMIHNIEACVSAKTEHVPYCQDCGTDSMYLFRGNHTIISQNKKETILSKISEGALKARKENPFRSSIFCPEKTNSFTEKNSGDNSPPEIHYFAHHNPLELYGIFSNKGGGSGSKCNNFSVSPLLAQDEDQLIKFILTKIQELGHSACPPYHLVIVLGGISSLQNIEIVTRATIEDDTLFDDHTTNIIRSNSLEQKIANCIQTTKLGAQGHGNYFIMPNGLQVLRLPRHAAHFFVGIGVSCSAHRIQKFKINSDGVFLGKLEKHPENFLPKNIINNFANNPQINFEQPKKEVLQKLYQLKAGDHFTLTGKILGARDKAHFVWYKQWKATGKLPNYLQKFLAVCYVGPADTPNGSIIGSFGPTTAGRMDDFAKMLFSQELLPLSIAKGSRNTKFIKYCAKYKGMFAAMQGGPAAWLRKFVIQTEVVDLAELGMEAVRMYNVKDLPVQMVIDSQGNNFYDITLA